jgi:hypothetical protein
MSRIPLKLPRPPGQGSEAHPFALRRFRLSGTVKSNAVGVVVMSGVAQVSRSIKHKPDSASANRRPQALQLIPISVDIPDY